MVFRSDIANHLKHFEDRFGLVMAQNVMAGICPSYNRLKGYRAELLEQFEDGDYKKALETVRRCREVAVTIEQKCETHLTRALLLEKAGRWQEAVLAYHQATLSPYRAMRGTHTAFLTLQ